MTSRREKTVLPAFSLFFSTSFTLYLPHLTLPTLSEISFSIHSFTHKSLFSHTNTPVLPTASDLLKIFVEQISKCVDIGGLSLSHTHTNLNLFSFTFFHFSLAPSLSLSLSGFNCTPPNQRTRLLYRLSAKVVNSLSLSLEHIESTIAPSFQRRLLEHLVSESKQMEASNIGGWMEEEGRGRHCI